MIGIRKLLLGGLVVFLAGCDSRVVYKAHETIKDAQWYTSNSPVFKVNIEDTSRKYNVYYLLRNTLQYPYYNLYLTREIRDPDNKILSNLLVELMISDEETGKPYGDGLGDLFDHKVLFLKEHTFSKPGVYTFKISQAMRQNPLPFIMSIGISVEKAEE